MSDTTRTMMTPKAPMMLQAAGKWVQRLLGLALLIVVAINVANATGRYVLGVARLGTDEAMVYIMIWVVMAGAVLAYAGRSHLAIDLLPGTLSRRGRLGLYLLHDLAVMLGCGYAAHASWTFIARIAPFGTTSMGLGVPMTVPHTALLAGFGGLTLVAAAMFFGGLIRLVTGTAAPDHPDHPDHKERRA